MGQEPGEIRQEIEETRAQMGDTVDALAYKADVKTRVKESIADKRDRLCAGLAGAIEVAAEYGRANASLNAGYGYTGILIAFLARFNPLAIMPMAILLGGLGAAGGLLQRRMGLPDATIQVLQGLIFVSILASDTLYGRFRWFQPRGTA